MSKTKKEYSHRVSGHAVYLAISSRVETVMAEIEVNGVEDTEIELLSVDLTFDALPDIVEHCNDEGYAVTRVVYPKGDDVKDAFEFHGAQKPHLRLLEIDSDEESYNVKVRIGGYRVVYKTPTLEIV